MTPETLDFIRRNADADIRQLALKGAGSPAVDLPFALDQIRGRQVARTKLPTWAQTEGIIYPPHLSMEQCSSEQTARYKASLVPPGRLMADLTGGLGVDFSLMSQQFSEAVYVEQDEQLYAISSENFKRLDLRNVQTICGDGMELLQADSRHFDLIYLDPARRDSHGARTYGIGDCTPNVLEWLELLLDKADRVMVKLSPMLDWRKTVADVGESWVREVHIVSVQNECKELLLVLSRMGQGLRVVCVNDADVLEFQAGEADATGAGVEMPAEGQYLYEPNASVMKAGCFVLVEQRFHVHQLEQNSHLFVSADFIEHFPGRVFQIQAISTMNKHDLKKKLEGIDKVNVSVRNFPMKPAELLRRLKLKEGGSVYMFATTLADRNRVLLITRKPCTQP